MKQRALLVAAALSLGCASAHAPRSPCVMTSISYDARVISTNPWVVDVDLTFTGGANELAAPEDTGLVSISVEGVALEPRRGRWPLTCRGTCRVHYRYDLTQAAFATEDAFDAAVRSGDDITAPGSTWLLRPEPMVVNVPVKLAVKMPEGFHFASGLHRVKPGADVFDLESQELLTAGFTAFGTFEQRHVVIGEDADHPSDKDPAIDVAILGGKRAVSSDEIETWVKDEARAVAGVFGRFPVDRALVVIVPGPNSSEVDFGRTLPSGGATTIVLLGDDADKKVLYDDWILPHELFHYGVPSFWHEGKWLDEGLATYYEPILRTRAGLMTDTSLWNGFARDMPRGLPRRGDHGLVAATQGARVYWGGAMFVLQADLLIRERTKGDKSLDDGLREVLARGGDATQVWTVDSFLRVIDSAVKVPVMTELYKKAAHARVSASCPELSAALLTMRCLPQERSDVAGLLRAIGVERAKEGELVLHDDAPLAPLRRKIVRSAR